MVGRNIQEPEINEFCSLTDQNNVRPVCQNKTLDDRTLVCEEL